MAEPSKHISSAHELLEKQITFCKWVAWCMVVVGVVAAGWGVYTLPADLPGLGSYLQGATGSLFGLAGLMFIYVAFLGQKQQLLIQNEQLEAQKRQSEDDQQAQQESFRQQRHEIERQQKQFEVQQRSIERQAFDNYFFQLLNLQNQIASQLRQTVEDGKGGTAKLEGRECFASWYADLKQDYARQLSASQTGRVSVDMDKCYACFYHDHQEVLGHYFRNLYHLVKVVKLSDVVLEYKDKRRYTSLVRAQLSAYELALLYYNGLSEFGRHFKPWIEEFGLLEHLDKSILLDERHGMESPYDERAFQ
jgi:hypothetical protein